jgi:hypothetical protein
VTINTSVTREATIETIIKRAYQLAGLMNANETASSPEWSAKFEMAADFLDMEMKALQANATIQRHKRFVTQALVAGTASYAQTSPNTFLDVLTTGMFKATGETTETPVRVVDMEAYNAITDKTSSGTPSLLMFKRGNVDTLYVWPVPSEAGTLTLIVHGLIADGNDQSRTVDLERHWVKYLVLNLAHWLAIANTLPPAVVGNFEHLAEKQFEKAKGYSKSSVGTQMIPSHKSAWR